MPSATPNKDFEALYLQRITAELAEDLEFLRTSEDFSKTVAATPSNNVRKGDKSTKATGANTSTSHHGHADDSPLEMLIAALRQGAEMFGPEDQKRIVGNGAP